MKNLFTFKGRINRSKYFLYHILGFMPFIILVVIAAVCNISDSIFSNILFLIALVSGFIIETCVVVQRLHDIDRPGICYWLAFVPLLNMLLGFTLLFKKGTDGPNKYGEDPLGIKEIA